jgi:hypothetical protein
MSPKEDDEGTQKPKYVKATFYITPDHALQLEEYRLKLARQGEKVDKSELIRRAIELLVRQ